MFLFDPSKKGQIDPSDLFYNYIQMALYKLKWVSIEYSEKFNKKVLIVPLVWRWENWKFDKFIPMREAIDIVADAVIKPDDKYLVMSHKDKKKTYKEIPVLTVREKKKRSLEDFSTHISTF